MDAPQADGSAWHISRRCPHPAFPACCAATPPGSTPATVGRVSNLEHGSHLFTGWQGHNSKQPAATALTAMKSTPANAALVTAPGRRPTAGAHAAMCVEVTRQTAGWTQCQPSARHHYLLNGPAEWQPERQVPAVASVGTAVTRRPPAAAKLAGGCAPGQCTVPRTAMERSSSRRAVKTSRAECALALALVPRLTPQTGTIPAQADGGGVAGNRLALLHLDCRLAPAAALRVQLFCCWRLQGSDPLRLSVTHLPPRSALA